MSQPSLDIDQFAFLLRRVAGATSLTILAQDDSTVFSVGDPVDLDGVVSGLRELRTGEVILVEDLPADLGAPLAAAGDWVLVEPTGPTFDLLMVILAPGEPPAGEAAAALELVLSGARERKAIIGEMEHLAEVVRRETADSLLETIARAQRDFILDGDPRDVFARLLDDVLELTDSEYGFIGEVEHESDGEPVLRTWAITNIAWTDELRGWFEENNPSGIVFGNLDTLFGEVIRSATPVVANTPALDPRSGGLPEGHPPLDSFLGLPFVRGDSLLGMVGLANRPGGYDEELIERLEPFLTTCSALIEALHARREQAASESRLRTSEARTSAVLESVVDPVVVTDEHGTIDRFNAAAEETFGYRPEDIIGRAVSRLVDGHETDDLDDLLRSVIDRELQGARHDGSVFPLAVSVAEVDTEDGQLYAFTCRDLTQKHAAEREIRMYAATIEATPDFVGVARVDGDVLAINEAGRRMMGVETERPLETLRIGDIHAPWSQELVRDVGLPAAVRDGAWVGETAFVAPDGREVPMSQVIVVSKDDDGVPQLVSTIARDISDSKEIERVKSEFVSTVSHELRTPLTSIRGSLGLVAGGIVGELPPRVTEMIELAQTNTERLIRLVNNILDFEKAQAGRLEVQLADVEPLEVVATAEAAVAGVAIESGVEIEVVAPEKPLAPLRADADRLVQVLVNLLGNALKFSAAGDRIVLRLAPTDTGATEFAVIDQGPGIPAAELDAIFEPFHQVDSSDRRAVGGSGLGLAIAHTITEAHGGHISVDSEPGRGSTFSVVLPPADAATVSDAPARIGARPDVLIADDDPSTRTLVRQLVHDRGLTCTEAATGHDVLHHLQHTDPRLLVLDLGLPGMDGFAIVDQLRAAGIDGLPIVVFTGRDLSADDRARLNLGRTRYLTKSRAGDDELVAAISSLLEPPTAEAV